MKSSINIELTTQLRIIFAGTLTYTELILVTTNYS